MTPSSPSCPHPSKSGESVQLLQNLNGPCSLLAISNILLLRGSITLPGPPNRSSISFGTLSTVLIDYLTHQSLPEPHQLDSILSIIPSTQTGLDLNPRFASIDGFTRDSHPLAHGLDIFSAVGIPLVHGWIADSQDLETWDVIVGKCGDYDRALESVVAGEELIAKQIDSQLDLTPAEQTLINEALIVRKFLDSTSTQLSYPGLFQLASALPPNSLAALLRNSHLSVLYRRPILPVTSRPPPAPPAPPLPPTPHQVDPDYDHQTALEVYAVTQQLMAADLGAQDSSVTDDPNLPKLFTLATDLSFLTEPEIVWESLEDVEGALSEFYDWRLKKSELGNNTHQPGRRNPDRNPDNLPTQSTHPNHLPQQTCLTPSQQDDDLDYTLAHQLQEEEYQRAAAQQVTTGASPRPAPPPAPIHIPVNGPLAISSPARPPAMIPTHQGPHPTPSKKKKKDCIIV